MPWCSTIHWFMRFLKNCYILNGPGSGFGSISCSGPCTKSRRASCKRKGLVGGNLPQGEGQGMNVVIRSRIWSTEIQAFCEKRCQRQARRWRVNKKGEVYSSLRFFRLPVQVVQVMKACAGRPRVSEPLPFGFGGLDLDINLWLSSWNFYRYFSWPITMTRYTCCQLSHQIHPSILQVLHKWRHVRMFAASSFFALKQVT